MRQVIGLRLPVYPDLRVEYGGLRLGGAIRDLRKSRGWTPQEMANKLSLSLANLSAIENDKAVLHTERLAANRGGIRRAA